MVNICIGHIDIEERVRIWGGKCWNLLHSDNLYAYPQRTGEEGWGLQAAFSECILLARHAFGHFKAKHVFVEYNS